MINKFQGVIKKYFDGILSDCNSEKNEIKCGILGAIFPTGRSRSSMSISKDFHGNYIHAQK